MMRVPGRERARSSSARNISGASVSCRTQLTMMSCPARNPASGTRPVSVMACAAARVVASSWSKCTIRAEWIGEPTAVTPRWVSTSTSWTPSAPSAVTAPRAVAPKPITAARSRRP